MDMRSRLELANDNAAAFWLAQARVRGWEAVRRPDFTAVRCEGADAGAHRVVVTRRYDRPDELVGGVLAILRTWRTTHMCLEDPYGRLDLAPHGFEPALGQPVMTREAGPEGRGGPGAPTVGAPPVDAPVVGVPMAAGGRVAAAPGGGAGPVAGARGGAGAGGGGIEVREATGSDGLAEAERTVVEGFPLSTRLPHVRGATFPPELLDAPGYRVWSARRNGVPAGACVSYDDGTSVGIYTVATLPEHRSRGVGRAVVSAALDAHPARVATLTATLLGEPLYRRLGFTERGVSRWWRYAAASSTGG